MDTNKEKNSEIKLLDSDLNEIAGGVNEENFKKSDYAVALYSVRPIITPVRPGDKLENIEKLLKEWMEKWEKRKAEKDKAKKSDIVDPLSPQ